MKKPLISIITCTYNSEKYLRECLDSIISQNFDDYEHLIIDGYSSDKTNQLIKSYQSKNNKVKLFQTKPKGIADAMNQGIAHAKGEYLYFLHSDDKLADANVLTNISEGIKEKDYPDWVYGQVRVIDSRGVKQGVFPRQSIFHTSNPLLLKYINYIPHQATFVRRAVFDKYGQFDQSLKTVMDYDLWLRIARSTRWYYLPIVVAEYRIHSFAQSSSRANLSSSLSELKHMRSRYLNYFEVIAAAGFDYLLSKINKTLQ